MSLLLTPTEGKKWMGTHAGEGTNPRPGHRKNSVPMSDRKTDEK